MSDTTDDDESTESSSTDDDNTSSSSDDDTDKDTDNDNNTDDDDNASSDEEEVPLIQVGDVRTAMAMATGGKNSCKLDQFDSVLTGLNIKISDKNKSELFLMLDDEGTNEVAWNKMFYALRDGQTKFKGMPMRDVIGGLLYEFAASKRGREIKARRSKQTSFMQAASAGKPATGLISFHMDDNKSMGNSLSVPQTNTSTPVTTTTATTTTTTSTSTSASTGTTTEPISTTDTATKQDEKKDTSAPRISVSSPITPITPQRHSKKMSVKSVTSVASVTSNTSYTNKRMLSTKKIDLNLSDLSQNTGLTKILSHSVLRQDRILKKLYSTIDKIEQQIRSKYSAKDDIINGMNNILLLKNTIEGIAKSSVQAIKSDMNDVLYKSSIHSSNQVSSDISSQLIRMNHNINKTNKILSINTGNKLKTKIDKLEEYLTHIDTTHKDMFNVLNPDASAPSTPSPDDDNDDDDQKNKSLQFPFDRNKLIGIAYNETWDDDYVGKMKKVGISGAKEDDMDLLVDDMDVIKKQVASLDDCLQKIVTERLLKLEKSVFALFGQLGSGKKNRQLMPVEELAIQLDAQKNNFVKQINKKQLKIDELEKLLKHQQQTQLRAQNSIQYEKELLLSTLGRYLEKEVVIDKLRNELKHEFGNRLKGKNNGNHNNNNNINDKKDNKDDDDDDDDKRKSVSVLSASSLLAANDYCQTKKYDDATALYQNKLAKHNEMLQMKTLKSILEYKSIDDIPTDKDELPDFMIKSDKKSDDNDDDDDDDDDDGDDDRELELKLGFGYSELLRLYRSNTHLNVQVSFAKWEIDKLRKELDYIKKPVIVQTKDKKGTELSFKLKLQSYIDKVNAQRRILIDERKPDKLLSLIDKYRIEMYRDMKKEMNLSKRKLHEDKLEIASQKRMIKKLFSNTKLRASVIMKEAQDLRSKITKEISDYQKMKQEAILARVKYEDRLNKMNKDDIQKQIINEEVEKHIEIYKDHLEDEANAKAQAEKNEELEEYKDELQRELNAKIEDMLEDIEKERVEHEKEVLRLKNECKSLQSKYDACNSDYANTLIHYNKIKYEKTKLEGKLNEYKDLYDELKKEFDDYKTEMTKKLNDANAAASTANNNNNSSGGSNGTKYLGVSGPVDPCALYAGYHPPSVELAQARKSYKSMKMSRNEIFEAYNKLLKEKNSLGVRFGRLSKENEELRELLEKRDGDILKLQRKFDYTITEKLRPFIKLIEKRANEAWKGPKNHIFNYKKYEFASLEDDLWDDQSDWYIHKNHILRTYFFMIEEWFRDHFWLHERIVQCNASVHEAMQQVLKDTWLECRIQTHAFIRWFGDLDRLEEQKLFYCISFSNEERYVWNCDIYDCINDYRTGVIDKYYKDSLNEREERREGYWQRHPDVYNLYKKKYCETIKRYKNKQKEMKAQVDYMNVNKLDILKENDIQIVKNDLDLKKKQASQLKRQNSKNSSKHRHSKKHSKKISINKGDLFTNNAGDIEKQRHHKKHNDAKRSSMHAKRKSINNNNT